MIDEIIEEVLPTILSTDPLGTYRFDGNLSLFNLGSTVDEVDYNLNPTHHLESSSWVFTYKPLPPLAISPMLPSIVFLPKLELKHLPDSLKYVFIGPKETLSIIISSLLSCDQEKELIRTLS